MNKKYCSIIQISILSISIHLQNLIKIHKLIHKILSINKILTLIKGHNSVKNWWALDTTWILYISMHIQNVIKIHPFILKILRNNTFFFTSIKGHNSVGYKQISPSAIPNHSSLISMSMQSLKKIGQKLFKFESGNEVLADRRMDTQT